MKSNPGTLLLTEGTKCDCGQCQMKDPTNQEMQDIYRKRFEADGNYTFTPLKDWPPYLVRGLMDICERDNDDGADDSEVGDGLYFDSGNNI